MIECDEATFCDTNCWRGAQGWFLGSIVLSTFNIEYTCHSDVFVYVNNHPAVPRYQYIHTADVNNRRHASMAVCMLGAMKT